MRIEEKVNEIIELSIIDRLDLTVEHLSYIFGVHILYNHQSNFYVQKSGVDIIGLKFDKRWVMFEAFCHEAGHMFLHATHQNDMPKAFNELQEAEARKFALCLMMPEKLICENELFSAEAVRDYFNVSLEKAIARLEIVIQSSRYQSIFN